MVEQPAFLTFLVASAAVVGLAVGSFLNVVIHRVPAGLSVVSPRSACPRCGVPIDARDNVPVLSWVLLRGRSRCCGEPSAARYPLVELATAAAFALVVGFGRPPWAVPALLWLAAITVALTVIDLDLKRLPDAIVLPSYPVAAALLTVAALAEGEPGRLVRAAVCGAASWLFYFTLIMINPRGMGFGDVKLSGVLGLYLGWYGYGQAVVGLFGGFVVGGVVGSALMGAGRAGRKSAIPFGPFMLIGAWLGLIAGGPVAHAYLHSMGL